MRPIGIHIRLNNTLDDAIVSIQDLGLTAFQIFLVNQTSGRPLRVRAEECARFANFVHSGRAKAFIHASYLINPASMQPLKAHYVFTREVALAQRLGFTHMVLHSGAAPKNVAHQEGIKAIARFINDAMRTYPSMTFMLENSAFARPSIGGNLDDFGVLLHALDQPDRMVFCIDTAHAYSYGYSLDAVTGCEEFVRHIDNTLGLARVALLHINDTHQACGTCADRHALLGQGLLGSTMLRTFAMHNDLLQVPIIAELPTTTMEQEKAIMAEIRSWHQ